MTERQALSDLVKAYRKVVGLEGAWDQELVNAEAVLKKGEEHFSFSMSLKDVKTVTHKYQVLHNLPKEEVYKIAETSEPLGIFTFPIYTGSVESVPDFSDVPSLDFLVKPMHLRHTSHIAPYVEYLQKTILTEEVDG